MIYTWDVSCVTASERIVVRTIKAASAVVARRKMRRKFKMPIRSVYARLAAEQEAQPVRLNQATMNLIEEKANA
jgi:hypothetical protein